MSNNSGISLRNALAGAVAGFAATGPMTLLMESLFPALPKEDRYPLPPQRITRRVLNTLDVSKKLSRTEEREVSYLAHFGYGAAAGSLFGLVEKKLPGDPIWKGVAYGLGVWSASYLGFLPKTGMHPSAVQEPASRNALMIAAHVVWGAALGAAFQRDTKQSHRS